MPGLLDLGVPYNSGDHSQSGHILEAILIKKDINISTIAAKQAEFWEMWALAP